MNAMVAKLHDNWTIPDGTILLKPEEYLVTVRLQINRDRRLAAPPKVVSTGSGPLYQMAAEAAKRAVLQAEPFEMLPVANYDDWKELDIDFDPNQYHKPR